jgi:alanyl-tRNA synthetase
MISSDIRRRFLKYFHSHSHVIVPSSPVVPQHDATLLFTNAGMNQFKDTFLGKIKREYTRAVTSQKCVRVGGKHNDLDNVGHTSRHLTFFEMLGNFSFGDYFKKEAIGFAWDVATHIFDFDPNRIWASVYKDDDEAYSLWEKHLPASRIVRFGEKENFWSMGEVGPCGPCSEILYDRGEKFSSAATPYEDINEERFLEFWNLVFMEMTRSKSGEMTPLPKKNIDTGAGLERLLALSMNVDTVFETDVLRGIISRIESLSNISYDKNNHTTTPAFHVISDHIRTLAFAIADGAVPSNTDRGYVLRKLIRRAVRYGKSLNFKKPFLAQVLPELVDLMGDDYNELKSSKGRIEEILTIEEEAFLKTLNRGGNLLYQVIEASHKKIKGEDAFKLKDTYGFPIEEILLIAKDANLEVDLPKFNQLEMEAKEKSKKALKSSSETYTENFFSDFSKTHAPCHFLGYEKDSSESKIISIVVNGKFVDTISKGEEGLILLDKTPFYPEKGGQTGDIGLITKGENKFIVSSTTSPYSGVIAHIGKIEEGQLHKQETITAQVHGDIKKLISNNHSATHILHWALGEVLGPHIKQAGSIVDANRLRFDFNHHKSLSKEEIRSIENLVNEKIRHNLPITSYIVDFDKAQKDTSIKQIFGEKYDSQVRVIDFTFAKELCGGTHATMTGDIGLFKIEKESSIAAGIRRIEAITGILAEQYVEKEEDLLLSIATLVKSPLNVLEEKVTLLLSENKKLQSSIKAFRKDQIEILKTTTVSNSKKIKGITFIGEVLDLLPDEVSSFISDLSKKLKTSFIIAIAIKNNNKLQVFVKVSHDVIEDKGIYANDLIKAISPIIQGGGGGKKDSATAGGKDISQAANALSKIYTMIEEKC